MQVDVSESQAARFAIMQYAAMLRRLPEGSLVEKFNNNDTIVVDGVGTIPFPNAEQHVTRNRLSFGFLGENNVPGRSPSTSPTVRTAPGRLPMVKGDGDARRESAVPREMKLTLMSMEAMLQSIGAKTVDCVTANDYAVRLYQTLDRQYDLTAEVSGAVVKARRPFGVPFPAKEEQKVRGKLKKKLSSLDGSSETLADAQRKIVKLQDRVVDLQSTIDRLKRVKEDVANIQVAARQVRETCAKTKQTARFQFLDMQDFLQDQLNRLQELVGYDELRAASGISGAGSMNAARKAALDEQIRIMKEQNPLRDSASVLQYTLQTTADELQRILRLPLNPAIPVDDSDDEEEKKKAKPKKKRPPNCFRHLLRVEEGLPKPSLTGKQWDLLKGYDKAGMELDLLKRITTHLKALQQAHAMVGQWFVERGTTGEIIAGLKSEVGSLQRQLTEANNATAAAENAAAEAMEALKLKGGGAKAAPTAKASAVAPAEGKKEKEVPPSSRETPAVATGAVKGAAGKKPSGKTAAAATGAKAGAAKPAPASGAAGVAAAAASPPEGNETDGGAPNSAPVAPSESAVDITAIVTADAGMDSTAAASFPSVLDATLPIPSSTDAELSAAPGAAAAAVVAAESSVIPAASPTSRLQSPVKIPPELVGLERPLTSQSSCSDVASLTGAVSPPEPLPPLTSSLDSLAGAINATSSLDAKRSKAKPSAAAAATAADATKPPITPQGGSQASKSDDGKFRANVRRKSSTSGPAADKKSRGNGGQEKAPADDVLSSASSSTPPPQLTPSVTPRTTGDATRVDSPPPPSQQQQQQEAQATAEGSSVPLVLSSDVLVTLRSIFFEVASLGVPVRLKRLLGEICALLFPSNEARELGRMIRSSAVSDADTELLMQRLGQETLGDAAEVPLLPSAVRFDGAAVQGSGHRGPVDHHSEPAGGSAAFGSTAATDSASAAKFGPRKSSRAAAATTAAGALPTGGGQVAAQNPGTPPARPLANNSTTPPLPLSPTSATGANRDVAAGHRTVPRDSVVRQSTSGSTEATGAAPLFLTPPPSKLRQSLWQSGDNDDDDNNADRSRALTSALATDNQMRTPGALGKIRTLRQQFSSMTPARVAVADAVDPAELPDEDAAFARRKDKFVELTRKLLSDLPVMKRGPNEHPILEPPAADQPQPPLLFAPAKPFPLRQ